MSSMNFLIADVILFLSNTKINFLLRDATKIKSKQFSEFGSQTKSTLAQSYGNILELNILLSMLLHDQRGGPGTRPMLHAPVEVCTYLRLTSFMHHAFRLSNK